MSYKSIRAGSGDRESHQTLLKLVDNSAYAADVYSNLEAFLLRQGYRADADRVFVAGKWRERQENGFGLSWVGNWLLYLLVGYGRRLWQTIILCIAIVGLGCWLFSPAKMEPQKPEAALRSYNRFWYSLGLFLPVVNLETEGVWKPKLDQRFLRHYTRIQVLLGWVLIPVILAALTGLIR